MATITLGIDIAKAKFDVALFDNGKYKTKKFSNKLCGFIKLVDWLKQKTCKIEDVHVCMEATGPYWQELATYLHDLQCKVSIVNPAKIKYFSQSELSRNKTDKTDAKLISYYCFLLVPELWNPPAKHTRNLQALVKRAESLQKMLRQEQNRLDGAAEILMPSLEASIQFLTTELKQVRIAIKSHIQSNTDLQSKSNLLATIPGISDITIGWILAFIGDVDSFENVKQVTAFVGLNPKHRQSGSSVNGKTYISKIGDRQLRKALYMPAIVSKQYNPVIKEFCDRLSANGKSPMIVICAAMRKLLVLIYGVLKNKVPFDPSWQLSKC